MRKVKDGQPAQGAHSKDGQAGGGNAAVLAALAKAARAQQPATQAEAQPEAQAAVQPAAQATAYPSAQPAVQPAAQPVAQQPDSWQPMPFADAAAQAGGFAQPQPCSSPAQQPAAFGEEPAYPQPAAQPEAQPASFAQPQAQPANYAQPQPYSSPVPQPISQPVDFGQAQQDGFSQPAVYAPEPVPQPQTADEPSPVTAAFAAGAHAAHGENDAAAAIAAAAGADAADAAATGAHSAGFGGKFSAFTKRKGAHSTSDAADKAAAPEKAAASDKAAVPEKAVVPDQTTTPEKAAAPEKAPAEKGAHSPAAAKKKKRPVAIVVLAVVLLAVVAGAAWFFVSHAVPDTDSVQVVENALSSAKSANSSTVTQFVEKEAGNDLSKYGIDMASIASWLQEDMSYKVTKLNEQGTTATVTVKVDCHDLTQFQDCITAVAKDAVSSTDFQNVTTAEDAYKLIGSKAFERAKSQAPASKSFEVKLVKKGETWELSSEDSSGILSQLWK